MGLAEMNHLSGLVYVSTVFCVYTYKYILVYHIMYIIP